MGFVLSLHRFGTVSPGAVLILRLESIRGCSQPPIPLSAKIWSGALRFLPQAAEGRNSGVWGEPEGWCGKKAFARKPTETETGRLGLGCGVEVGRTWSYQTLTLYYDLKLFQNPTRLCFFPLMHALGSYHTAW